jgi:MoxR-like ATPase
MKIKLEPSSNPLLVPKTRFHDNPTHTRILALMLRDWLAGEHLMLIGNQGVGKNKLTDRFLELLRLPREYVQLHRDSTISQLTTVPVIQDGLIRYEDSPLVRAVRFGHVLVVDEADKAPAHVTSLLKTLASEDQQMQLSDGRRIAPLQESSSKDVIPVHKNFRMIILGNRPGFPFQGNDFLYVSLSLFFLFSISITLSLSTTDTI